MRGPSSSRGHALLLLFAVLAAVAATAAAVSVRLSVDLESRRAEDRRVQALWLARSAASIAQPGRISFAFGPDLAEVSTVVAPASTGKRVVATATFEHHGKATVEAVIGKVGAPVVWHELYER